MAVKPGAVVLGAEALQKRLQSMEPGVRKKVLRRGLRAAAKEVMAEAKKQAPIGSEADRRAGHPGALRKSFKVRALRRSRVRFGYKVFSPLPYATIIEYGKANTAPNKFMRRAARKKYDPTLVRRNISEALKEIY